MARSFRTRSNSAPRRKTQWIPLTPAIDVIATASTALLIGSLNAAALALRPFTIVRTRGFWSINSDQISASEDFDCSFGIAVVTDQAVAIGVTAVPTPVTDIASDSWFMYEQLANRIEFSDATGVRNVGLSSRFDSKAMRKVDFGQDLAIVLETSSASSGVDIWNSLRMLIKLH